MNRQPHSLVERTVYRITVDSQGKPARDASNECAERDGEGRLEEGSRSRSGVALQGPETTAQQAGKGDQLGGKGKRMRGEMTGKNGRWRRWRSSGPSIPCVTEWVSFLMGFGVPAG